MGVHLRAKCDVSSIILTGFRQGWGGGGLPTLTSKQTPKKPTQIRVKLESHVEFIYKQKRQL